jgi:hypothetical protein
VDVNGVQPYTPYDYTGYIVAGIPTLYLPTSMLFDITGLVIGLSPEMPQLRGDWRSYAGKVAFVSGGNERHRSGHCAGICTRGGQRGDR